MSEPAPWSVAEARGRVPADLIPTHDGLCGSTTYHPGCPKCAWLGNDKYRHASVRDRAARADRSRRSYAAGKGTRTTHARRRARTALAADTDFLACWPGGKPCHGCGEVLPAEAVKRSWTSRDGRALRCDRNGCRHRHERLKRDRRLAARWTALGLDPHVCAYCQSAPAEDLEHFVPRALGGTDDPSNLFPACPACNRGQGGKHDRPPFEWLAERYPGRVAFFRALFTDAEEAA